MAIPTDYIFQSGTVAKSGIFDLIVSKLVAAGWTSVASLPSSDGTVLKSSGNTGDQALVLNIRDTNASNANSVKTTAYCTISYRLQDIYTPGAAGVAGTFGRPALGWSALDIVPTTQTTGTLPMDTTINYKVYADASKIILAMEYPHATNLGPMLIYMGLPDSLYCTEGASRGVLFGTTANGPGANTISICNTPSGLGTVTATYTVSTYATISPKNPNNAGKYAVSHIYYGSATEGVRGKLDGIYALPLGNLITGDTITIGAKKYYALVCQSQGVNSFQSLALAVRTE